MLKDDEIQGVGNSYTTEFRQYDPRLGRWWSLDAMKNQFPWMSPYDAFDNNPIMYNDPKGLSSQDGRKGQEDDSKKDNAGNTNNDKSIGKHDTPKDGIVGGASAPKDAPENPCKGDNHQNSQGSYYFDGEAWAIMLKEPVTIYGPKSKSDAYSGLIGVGLGDFEKAFKAPISDFDANFNLNQRSKNFNNALNKLALTNLLVTGSPLIGYSAITLSPILEASTEFWYVKAGISTMGQLIVNEGKVNIVGVVGDGFFGYGFSSVIQSSFNWTYDTKSNAFNYTSIFSNGTNNISVQQMAFETSVGLLFGYKQSLFSKGFNKAYGPGRPSNFRNFTNTFLGSSLYTIPTNGINKNYEENHK